MMKTNLANQVLAHFNDNLYLLTKSNKPATNSNDATELQDLVSSVFKPEIEANEPESSKASATEYTSKKTAEPSKDIPLSQLPDSVFVSGRNPWASQ